MLKNKCYVNKQIIITTLVFPVEKFGPVFLNGGLGEIHFLNFLLLYLSMIVP